MLSRIEIFNFFVSDHLKSRGKFSLLYGKSMCSTKISCIFFSKLEIHFSDINDCNCLSQLAMQVAEMCVSCGFRFRPTLGLTLGLKQCNSQNLSANESTGQNFPANEAAGHPLVNGNKQKNNGVQKTETCQWYTVVFIL